MAELKIISMDEVQSKEVNWLWYPYIPYGKITIIQGDPGEGKTTLALRLAALLSKGEALPFDDTEREPVKVIYQTAEDGLEDTIKPRLEVAEADCSQIKVIDESEAALSMERHGIEWEHKGTHEKHLSVLDYKKQEREKEIGALENKLAEKKDEFRVMADRIENFDNGEKALQKLDESIMNEPEYQLPEPPAMMSARSYKTKFVVPLVARLKSLISTLFARYFKAIDSYNRLNVTNGNLYRENERLSKINDKLKSENDNLRSEVKDYKLLRKVFGHKQIDDLLERARNIKGRKRDNSRSR